jgi:hypothetical protein
MYDGGSMLFHQQAWEKGMSFLKLLKKVDKFV